MAVIIASGIDFLRNGAVEKRNEYHGWMNEWSWLISSLLLFARFRNQHSLAVCSDRQLNDLLEV